MAHPALYLGDEYGFIGEVMTWAFLDRDTVETFEAISKYVHIPRNYFLLDIETLGYGKQVPIVQIGWGVVNETELTNVESLLLNWSDPHYGQNQTWVREQIARITAQMAEKGKRYCTTYERMCQEGTDPIDAFEVFMQLINDYLDSGSLVVGHNAWMFDRKRIDHHCEQFFGRTPNWHPNAIFDTGLVEKAAQMNRPPYKGESLDEWYSRIYGGHSKIKWNLEDHCVNKYMLADRFGVDPSLAHDAGHDCRLTYCLFETYRQIAEAYLSG